LAGNFGLCEYADLRVASVSAPDKASNVRRVVNLFPDSKVDGAKTELHQYLLQSGLGSNRVAAANTTVES